MKPLLLITVLLLLFFDVTFAQDASVLRITNLPPEGISLDKGWKFMRGDNPAYASVNYDDKNWLPVDINERVSSFTQISKGDIIWLRLHLEIEVPSHDSLFVLMVNQYGASEIYINGVLLRKFGNIVSAKQHQSFNPHNTPIPFFLGSGQSHVLAIRFAAEMPSSAWVAQRSKVALLSIRLQSLSATFSAQKATLNKSHFQVGLTYTYAVFCLLFLLLFIFYPRQKLNLFFGLFNMLLVINFFHKQFMDEGQYSLKEQVYLLYADGLIARLIGINILLFMLYALNRIKPFIWWFNMLLLIDVLLSLILPIQYELVSNSLRAFFILLCLWVAIQSFRSRDRNNWLIGLVAMAVVFLNISFVLKITTKIDITSYAVLISPIVITLSMVTFLALRYAHANTSLEQQLVQVKTLSEQNIRHEQEKQQMLTTQKQNLERQVAERTEQIVAQKNELEKTLQELRATQAQLIQREKMASLGELTAGIAHEIQNPLNFINNFSEVNAELLEELQKEAAAGNGEEVIALAGDISQNLLKVAHHGRRADAIVKGMLQHSRQSLGRKEPTDINTLVDEYLRLAYHGYRAKDKGFNTLLETAYDSRTGTLEVVREDIGRVLLNLYNNAFYAVQQKKRKVQQGYEPLVRITTVKGETKVLITISDNGTGIPENVQEKVFQPFFTTKPTGEGTGLGLSLSYDILKAHGGELKVESTAEEGATFTIVLPTQK